jgi:hypothetical protein
MTHIDDMQRPDSVDVKWVQQVHSLKPGLQSKLRAKGLLLYFKLPETTKILYRRLDVEAYIASGKVTVKGASSDV